MALGTGGIVVYSEMCGRVAAVQQKAVFDVIREQLSRPLAAVTLLMSTAVNLITCAAEIGGVAILIRLFADVPFHAAVLLATLLLVSIVAFLPFAWIERFFGLLGLGMLVFAFAVFRFHPDWHAVAHGLVRQAPPLAGKQTLVFAYFVVGILNAVLMPYEMYSYASGGIEDRWKPSDTKMNLLIASVGPTLGSMLSRALILLGKVVFAPRGVSPEFIDTVAMASATPYGKVGVVLGLAGMFFAIAGAAAETAMAGAYNYAQYFRLPWGRAKKLGEAPAFNLAWLPMLAAGMLVMLTGVDPVDLVEYSVIFSAAVLPFTYWPVLKIAKDERAMGKHANSPITSVVAWVFLVRITLAAVAGVPLLFVTHAGAG